MASLEDELRSALRRREPSPDFAERVLARVSAESVRRAPRVSQPGIRWVVALAAALLLTAGSLEYRHYRGERARDQVLLAVRIAGSKLNRAQKKVHMLGYRGNS